MLTRMCALVGLHRTLEHMLSSKNKIFWRSAGIRVLTHAAMQVRRDPREYPCGHADVGHHKFGCVYDNFLNLERSSLVVAEACVTVPCEAC